MLTMIDNKVLQGQMQCVMVEESDSIIRVDFKLRLHKIGRDEKYFANTFSDLDELKPRPGSEKGKSYFLTHLLIELFKDDSGVEWVEARPFMVKICHTSAVSPIEIKDRIEKVAQQLQEDEALVNK
jgi:hypothetical protein